MIVSSLDPSTTQREPKSPISFPFLWIDDSNNIWLRYSSYQGARDICLSVGRGGPKQFIIGDTTEIVTPHQVAWQCRLGEQYILTLSNG
jgi:hypothetical protein